MMEYNGIFVDMEVAERDRLLLIDEITTLEANLAKQLPVLPPEFTFSWGSTTQKSCLIFGGSAKYKKWIQYRDVQGRPIFGESPVEYVMIGGLPRMRYTQYLNTRHPIPLPKIDRFAGGKRKNEIKTKKFKRTDLNKAKGKITDCVFEFPRLTDPKPAWKGKNVDGTGNPLYSVGKDVIEEIGARGIPFLNDMANYGKVAKDLSTYYWVLDKGTGEKKKGMLTCVTPDSIIHHKLNHTLTVTSRLSSSDPNLQNITRPDFDKLLGRPKSLVKRMFVSRFGKDGLMTEADYKQLEVVVQGLLTNDTQLKADLKAGVDFHCKRLSAKEDMPYEEVFKLCKVDKLEEWQLKRTKTKEFTFQRAFGAALRSIAAATGMAMEDVQKLSDAEEKLYPGITKFYDKVEAAAARSRVPTLRKEPYPDKPEVWINVGKGFYMTVTKARFVFYEKPSPKFLRAKGKLTSIYRPYIQNYPIQGTAAQVVQYVLGLLVRHFFANNNYNGKAYLVNTVHDCVWVDHHKDVTQQVRADLKRIMEMVPLLLKHLHDVDTDLSFPVDVETGPNMMELK